MRNGLNIASVSELVHEMMVVPEEALVRLRTRVSPLNRRAIQGATATLYGGTIRVARDFRFPIGVPSAAPAVAAGYDEVLLVALGGCVLVTFVQGCSARGITLTRVAVNVSARVGLDAEGAPFVDDVAYEYDVDCEGSLDVVGEIARYVSCLSPNHRAFLERGSVRVGFDREGLQPFVVEDVRAGLPGGTARQARVEWVYGTQLAAQLAGGRQMMVDQPKQYLGLDSAPNPQEYLLASAAAEFAEEIRAEASRRRAPEPDIAVLAEGSLDLRGITNLDENAPVRVHDIAHTLTFGPGVSNEAATALAQAAALRCAAHAAICRELAIQVTVKSRGERVDSFRSDLAMLKAYLAELALRKQQAAKG
jgi:uncharacterized OsmC-like protein